MLRLIPRPLHRVLLVQAHRVRLVWWRIRKPLLLGCRVLAFDGEGRILLVRHSYGSGRWMLPGGGIGRGEEPLLAALRELAEETACALEDPRELAVIEEPLAGTINRVHVITGRARGVPRGDGREIVAAEFFAPDALPPNLAEQLQRNLADWIRTARAGSPI
ncbi:MAG: NUDIX domain-containing protein [Pseudomonadota bacterium]|nr:NUDIX domain-containing protein [Pseudomonadota bacterium]